MPQIFDGTTGTVPASWTTAGRPTSPSAGQTGYNTTNSQLEYWNGSSWIAVAATTNASLLTSGTLAAARLPAGSILQVAQSFKTDVFSLTSQSYINVTGLTVNITPTSATSKILIMMNVAFSARTTQDSLYAAFGKNSSVMTATIGDAASSRPRATTVSFPGDAASVDNYQAQATQMYLDSPATTSAITYSVMMRTANGNTMYVNRTYSDRDTANYDGRWTSSIVVMEVAA